jgi:PAS domain S-box-containing protein
VWADLSVSLLRTGDGRPRFYLAQLLDITERKAADEALRASQQRLADAQAVGHVGSWEWEVEPDRISWSDELHHIFGLALDATPKSPDEFMTYVHPDDLEHVQAAVGTLEGGTDYRIIRPDGQVRWVNGRRGLVSRPGEPRRIAGTIHDVTDRKRGEEELRRSNAELEQYAHAASHDLATPLTTIGGFASLLGMRYGDQLPDEARTWLDSIVRGTERMRAMLDAMLAYSRVQHGERMPEPVDLTDLVGDVLADLQAPIRERGAEVGVDTLPTVNGEPALLRQVLLNLIANALKFAPPGEPPRVRVAAERAQAGWTIAVADRGIGMRPEDAERAFELFTRLESAADYPGSGMGLALCRRIVERHGGRIWVDGFEGEGSTFSFTIPDDQPE